MQKAPLVLSSNTCNFKQEQKRTRFLRGMATAQSDVLASGYLSLSQGLQLAIGQAGLEGASWTEVADRGVTAGRQGVRPWEWTAGRVCRVRGEREESPPATLVLAPSSHVPQAKRLCYALF